MTVGATAITLFYPPVDTQRFSAWLAGLLASARDAPGYVSARESVQGDGQLDWAVEVSFDDADLLDEWLDSAERQAAFEQGEAQEHRRRACDLVLNERELPPGSAPLFPDTKAPRFFQLIPPGNGCRSCASGQRASSRGGFDRTNANRYCHGCAGN